MSTTPPDIRRVSLRAALGIGAAFTAAAFGAGFTLAADQSGSADADNIVVEHSVGPRHGTGNQSMTGDPLPGVCTGYSATMGNEAAMREESLSTACQFIRDSRAKDAEAAVQALRDAARVLERGRR
ncbi:hypothetical protein [Streptomyces sp. NBC_00842]|uniref:hypothetical protein n=1 Tax=Streptomyces sp. NBC_00842 TaxID=2975848 RepID=UPI003867885C|nr:hypothetical protein OH821_32850 [Streptomyces sp. NBC_00842]